MRKGLKGCAAVLGYAAVLAISGCGNTEALETVENGTEEIVSGAGIESIDETATGSEERLPTGTKAAEAMKKGETIPEKLDALRKINGDAYAWLDIPGTDISFPILQDSQDTAFYLSHNEDREEDGDGCIYTEYVNSRDFTDNNTVVYGRNVGGRFGKLHEYQDRDFFDRNRNIVIYMPGETFEYKIFAAYPYDDRHLIASYDFSDETVYQNYLNEILATRKIDSFIDTSVEVTANDRIITLSTGVTGQDDQRYLVQAVLVKGAE